MPSVTNLPITNVKPVAGFLGEMISAIAQIDDNQDGKITFLEIVNKVQVLGFKAFGTFRGISMKDFKAELKDVDLKELDEIIEDFAKSFKLRKEQVEWLIEDWLRFLAEGAKLIDRTIEVGRA